MGVLSYVCAEKPEEKLLIIPRSSFPMTQSCAASIMGIFFYLRDVEIRLI